MSDDEFEREMESELMCVLETMASPAARAAAAQTEKKGEDVIMHTIRVCRSLSTYTGVRWICSVQVVWREWEGGREGGREIRMKGGRKERGLSLSVWLTESGMSTQIYLQVQLEIQAPAREWEKQTQKWKHLVS